MNNRLVSLPLRLPSVKNPWETAWHVPFFDQQAVFQGTTCRNACSHALSCVSSTEMPPFE